MPSSIIVLVVATSAAGASTLLGSPKCFWGVKSILKVAR